MTNAFKYARNLGIAVVVACAAFLYQHASAYAVDYYGAIAYSQDTDAHGWAYDYKSQIEAESAAMLECAKHGGGCKIATWCKNACCALAVGRGYGWGADWGRSKEEAQKLAVRRCNQHTSNCSVRRWVCTTR